MAQVRKVFLIMIDGVSADYFAEQGHTMPVTRGLAEQGLLVQRMRPECCGNSMPGRASIITGNPSRDHGVYGNMVLADNDFRYADPYDIRVPTLASRAHATGKDVASIGYGLVRPEDCSLYSPPWWARDYICRARDGQKIPMPEGWRRANRTVDDGRLQRVMQNTALCEALPFDNDLSHESGYLQGTWADQVMLSWATELACLDDNPDLIMVEINQPDEAQHKAGYNSDKARLSIATADALVGATMARLAMAGKLEEYAFVVTSDHGHDVIEEAIYPSCLRDTSRVALSEGSMLLVADHSEQELVAIAKELAPFGVERFDNDFLPDDARARIAVFVAPKGKAFENPPAGCEALSGAPKYVSSHGLWPGNPAEDRFCVVSHPSLSAARVADSPAESLAPSVLKLLGVDADDLPCTAWAMD